MRGKDALPLIGGVSADGAEALVTADDAKSLPDIDTYATFNIIDTVIAWQSGAANRGWVLLSSSTDGWDFVTSRGNKIERHPLLTVEVCE